VHYLLEKNMLKKSNLFIILSILFAGIVFILSRGEFMTKTSKAESLEGQDQQAHVAQIRKRLTAATNLTMPLAQELTFLEELSEFDLGRFLIANQRLNGFWLSYMITDAPLKDLKNPLEYWLINHAPAAQATRERFHIFQDQLQKYATSGMTIASIPCGPMHNLMEPTLPQDIKFVGVALDPESLNLSKESAEKYKKDTVSSFMQQDPWHLGVSDSYDIISSNGLNIYEPDDAKVVDLYKQFFMALKSGGILITSFMTPPPEASKDSPWKNFNQEDLLKQNAIFNDILQVKWQSFRTEAQVRTHLKEAGFDIVDVIYDKQGMFPAIVARKR
jgi:hypothetical protein